MPPRSLGTGKGKVANVFARVETEFAFELLRLGAVALVAVFDEQRAVILKPEDVAEAVLFVASLPPRVSIPELVIKPTTQMYW